MAYSDNASRPQFKPFKVATLEIGNAGNYPLRPILCAFSPDSSLLLIVQSDGGIKLWSTCTGSYIDMQQPAFQAANYGLFNPNPNSSQFITLYSLHCTQSPKILVWSIRERRPTFFLEGHTHHITLILVKLGC